MYFNCLLFIYFEDFQIINPIYDFDLFFNKLSFIELFNKKTKFCQQIEYLISSMKRINNDPFVRERLDQLKISIESCIKNSGSIYIYGSRLYGVVKDDSDVDLYFDTGNFNYMDKSK